jgi:Rrf2 family nitric oxide-sensitive transcriptional repressor
MQISLFSDYALRTLIYLGIHPDRRVTLQELARAYGISLDHLRKVVHRLAQLGYIDSRRGRNGGLQLALPPRDIYAGEVIQAMEPTAVEPIDCLRRECRIVGACRLQGALIQAMRRFYEELDQFTLADLMDNREQLLARLPATG